MSKEDYIEAYAKMVKAECPWAADEERFTNFMAGMRLTVEGRGTVWIHDGPVAVAAWKSLGGKGKPTLKALRALV